MLELSKATPQQILKKKPFSDFLATAHQASLEATHELLLHPPDGAKVDPKDQSFAAKAK